MILHVFNVLSYLDLVTLSGFLSLPLTFEILFEFSVNKILSWNLANVAKPAESSDMMNIWVLFIYLFIPVLFYNVPTLVL